MFDAATAAIIITAILGVAAPVTAAIIKFAPSRQPDRSRVNRSSGRISALEARSSGLEARMATNEANITNVTKSLDEFREEFHQLRSTLLERWKQGPNP